MPPASTTWRRCRSPCARRRSSPPPEPRPSAGSEEYPGTDLVHCRRQLYEDVAGPLTVQFPLDQEYDTVFRGEVQHTRCGGAGPDCVMRATDESWTQISTPIHFGPPRADPAITVTPSSGLHAGDEVQVEVVGFGAEPFFYVGQCENDIVDAPDPESALFSGVCGPLTGGNAWDTSVAETGDVDGGPCHEVGAVVGGRDQPVIVTVRLAVASFTAADGTTVDCTAASGACVLGAETLDGHFQAVPLSFAPPAPPP